MTNLMEPLAPSPAYPLNSRQETLVRVKDVSFGYGTVPILRGVCAEVKNVIGHGQVVGFLGPSGIGKTTLVKIMAGVLKAAAGSVTIQLNDKEVPVQPGMMGLVWQHYPLLSHRTVFSNLIIVGSSKLTNDQKKAKASELLELFGLTDKAGAYPSQLSGGQRQRVAIAQQLMRDTPYIIMDEPFSGLDPVAKKRVIEMIRAVADRHEHNTFIIITHDVRAAMKSADMLWEMGRDRNPDNTLIPGARIVEEIDLIALDLAYHEDLGSTPAFVELDLALEKRFETL